MRALLVSVAVGSLLLATNAAAAPTPTDGGAADREACATSYEAAQRAMRASQLLEARRELTACLDDRCSAFLRSDCAKWLNEVERRTPSVVVVLRRPAGARVAQGAVVVDGSAWAAGLDGKAQDIDPGEHVFRVTLPGEPPIERRVLVHEGERLQQIVLEAAPAPEWTGSPPPLPNARPVPTAALVFGGLAAVGALGFGTFAIMGRVEQSDLDGCKPDCSDRAVGSVRTKYNVADVFLGASVASLVTATILYLTRPVEPTSPASEARR